MKLFTKLFIAFLICALFCIFTVVILVNIYLNVKFADYVKKNQQAREKNVVDMFVSFHEKEKKFPPQEKYLGYFCMMMNTCVKVEDMNGSVVFNYCGSEGHKENYASPLALKTKNKIIGKIYINHMKDGIFASEDMVFKKTINFSILLAGIISCFFAFILSIIFSYFFLRPVKEMIKVSRKLADGDLSQRIEIFTNDEIGELGKTLNLMAENLQKLEALRKNLAIDLSHEIKTPLSIIRNYFEAFRDGVIQISDKKIDAIFEEIERLTKLVNNLHDLSLAEGGKLKLNKINVDLNYFIENLVEKIKPLYSTKQISLKVEYASPALFVRIDPEQMERVFLNILHNSYKFTPSGGEVKISIENPREEALIKIKDTGEGIPPSDLPYVFERFYRAGAAHKAGMGIGLHISRELVLAQNGKIFIKSEIGKGTEVIISLPVAPNA